MATTLSIQKSLDQAYSNSIQSSNKLIITGIIIILLGIFLFFCFISIFSLIFCFFTIIFGFSLTHNGLDSRKKSEKFKKGAFGEYIVSTELNQFPDDWYIFNDINMENYIGNTILDSQIDHILICPKGVYTIETKYHKGKIYGSENKLYWSQYLSRNEYKLYNPIKQGTTHSINLKKFFNKKGYNHWVNTIVVFSNQNVTLNVCSNNVPVLYIHELYDYLNNQKTIMNQKECLQLVHILKKTLITDSFQTG
jgi:hypothetical protein